MRVTCLCLFEHVRHVAEPRGRMEPSGLPLRATSETFDIESHLKALFLDGLGVTTEQEGQAWASSAVGKRCSEECLHDVGAFGFPANLPSMTPAMLSLLRIAFGGIISFKAVLII